ncbi:hypothetical protein PR003_g21251 [Phytophthora rubi]|uniref:RxLR effector protein n=1 Tax=Phytophthora rubi TaxID=129364 RepID=A0A6A3NJ63_9STRA|nr:hypothetical protein PR002_g4629 [Phytophthora rubi]KAE9046510.1 hypothetical protein PR001_g4528 [Phytophthora rubi]KAE9306415.1 hypothetical protein PR003_g21251 [Phytophthora rubi]
MCCFFFQLTLPSLGVVSASVVKTRHATNDKAASSDDKLCQLGRQVSHQRRTPLARACLGR